MPSQKKPDDPSQKKPANAFKHGIFAAVMIAPGEDPEEFEELHAELVREWEPDGNPNRPFSALQATIGESAGCRNSAKPKCTRI